MSGRGNKKLRAGLLIVAVLIICRATIPIPINGNWIGTLTKCACGDYWIMRFQDGRVKWYAHSDDEGSKPKDWGTYVKIGRNTYRWDLERGGGAITVSAGWFVSSFDGAPGSGRLYCWRDPLFWRADGVVRKMEANERKMKDERATKQ